eukprot:TRINITY_DN95166_c0_g1_i1.p1 TRINITY_DN95166_c0_g1~~TRINITY_DN95166_c0_g1_i1.p1  ORF type:complete len:150 (-),score=46.19 TRINITY_DN95166_c0_g1_i1:85-534(-)
MPGRGGPPPVAAEDGYPPGADSEGRAAIDAQAFQETAARSLRGAQQLFGNLRGWIGEAQNAVAETVAGLAEDGKGPLAQVVRRGTEAQKAAAGAASSTAASRRRDMSRKDAEQYFVEYKELDYSLLPPELQQPQRPQAAGHGFTLTSID